MGNDSADRLHAGQGLATERILHLAQRADVLVREVRWQAVGDLVVVEIETTTARVDRRLAREWLEAFAEGTTTASVELVLADAVRALRKQGGTGEPLLEKGTTRIQNTIVDDRVVRLIPT